MLPKNLLCYPILFLTSVIFLLICASLRSCTIRQGGFSKSEALNTCSFFQRDESKDGVVSLCLAGQKQYVVVMPSLIKQVFAQREAVLSNRSVAYQLAKNIFGDGGITAKIPGIYEHITSNLDILLTETALTEASNRTASQVGMSVSSLISFNSETSAQNLWERGSNLKILSGKLADTEVEVNLFHLVTRWTYWCATPAIFGSAFLDQNPSVMDDLFVFDEEFVSFMAGLPAFNTKLVRARSALDRSKKAIQVWYDAFQAVEDGRDPGPGWGNMQDINELVRVQLRTWREGGKEVEKAAHANLLSLLWGLHTVSVHPIHYTSSFSFFSCNRQNHYLSSGLGTDITIRTPTYLRFGPCVIFTPLLRSLLWLGPKPPTTLHKSHQSNMPWIIRPYAAIAPFSNPHGLRRSARIRLGSK